MIGGTTGIEDHLPHRETIVIGDLSILIIGIEEVHLEVDSEEEDHRETIITDLEAVEVIEEDGAQAEAGREAGARREGGTQVLDDRVLRTDKSRQTMSHKCNTLEHCCNVASRKGRTLPTFLQASIPNSGQLTSLLSMSLARKSSSAACSREKQFVLQCDST
jgi:hypothetical protein